jgi:tetratricopeptide (TPR) repeat protein
MKAYVFTDKSLDRYAGQFVWLAINTEDAKNAEFLKKYPIPALPTLLVLDAKHDAITSRYVGGATVPQLSKLLDDARKTYGAKALTKSDKYLAQANKLASDGKDAEAASLFEKALDAAPKDWPLFGRTAESFLFSLSMSDDNERCAARAEDLYARLKGTPSGASIAASGLGCALSVDEKHSKRAEWIRTFEKETRAALESPKLVLSGDDRSGLYMTLIDARDDAKDEKGARALREEWVAFLDKAAASAKTPEQRFVYDPHRLTGYIALGTPEKAIPMLEQSQHDFPKDYNPPARLAIAYKAMKEYDKALAASDRALTLVYGPRKLTVLQTRADILLAKGDKEGARAVMQQAVEYAKSLPEGQRNDQRTAYLEKKLQSMEQ